MIRLYVPILLACLSVCGVALAAGQAAMDDAIIAELNFARTQPSDYADALVAYRKLYRGKLVEDPHRWPKELTHEGVAAVDEAIAFLRAQPPLTPLSESPVLAASAASHVSDQGPTGQIGHIGTDGSDPGVRVDRFGAWFGSMAEDIAYGPGDAREVVRQLIIDDGVPDRGHRAAIFNARLRYAGAGCGPHRVYRLMCVIDFASGIRGK